MLHAWLWWLGSLCFSQFLIIVVKFVSWIPYADMTWKTAFYTIEDENHFEGCEACEANILIEFVVIY